MTRSVLSTEAAAKGTPVGGRNPKGELLYHGFGLIFDRLYFINY